VYFLDFLWWLCFIRFHTVEFCCLCIQICISAWSERNWLSPVSQYALGYFPWSLGKGIWAISL